MLVRTVGALQVAATDTASFERLEGRTGFTQEALDVEQGHPLVTAHSDDDLSVVSTPDNAGEALSSESESRIVELQPVISKRARQRTQRFDPGTNYNDKSILEARAQQSGCPLVAAQVPHRQTLSLSPSTVGDTDGISIDWLNMLTSECPESVVPRMPGWGAIIASSRCLIMMLRQPLDKPPLGQRLRSAIPTNTLYEKLIRLDFDNWESEEHFSFD